MNPAATHQQALDPRIAGYNQTLATATPFSATAGETIVKAVSVAASSPQHNVALDVVVVLTVVATPPPSDAFRPFYFGTPANRQAFKTYTKSDLQTSLLPVVQGVTSAPTDTWMINRFEKPQIDWLTGYVSRQIHPTQAMPDYGADIARDTGDAAMKLLIAGTKTVFS